MGAFATYLLLGIASGQVLAWLVGAAAAYTNLASIIALLLGEGAALGAIFLIGSTAYALMVGLSVAYGVGALAGKNDPDVAEAWTGFLAGVLAFLLVTLLAEQYVSFVINVVPDVAAVVGGSSGVGQFVAAVVMHAVPVGTLAVLAYLAMRAVFYSPEQTGDA